MSTTDWPTYRCGYCGREFQTPAELGAEVECPNCGTWHRLVEDRDGDLVAEPLDLGD